MPIFSKDQQRIFAILEEASRRSKMRVFVVGGAVRGLLSGESAQDHDIDFLVEGNAIDFAQSLAREIGGSVKRFDNFITAKILTPEKFSAARELDFASARTEVYEAPGALPKVSLSTIQFDLKRRDFSVNAMALPIEALSEAARSANALKVLELSVIDYFKGREDLAHKLIRVLHDKSFVEDPTRIFRAARYAARLSGRLETATQDLLEAAVAGGALETISEQRKINELRKILAERSRIDAIEFLSRWGVLKHIDVLVNVPLDRLLGAFHRISDVNFNFASIDCLAILLSLAGILTSGDAGQAFSKIGVSRKRMMEATAVREWLTVPPQGIAALGKVSDAGIAALSLLSQHGMWKDELRRRKLLESA